MVIKPDGYAIWENIQHELDKRFKKAGVKNVYMPLFIPESLLDKEKDHVEGFAPEVAWVTQGVLSRFRSVSASARHPRLCSVISTRKTSTPTVTFRGIQPVVFRSKMGEDDKTVPPLQRVLMAGGPHRTCDSRGSSGENDPDVKPLCRFLRGFPCDPGRRGQKTDKEKFAGAEATYTIESLMHDGKALQSGTSHNFGDGFAKGFRHPVFR